MTFSARARINLNAIQHNLNVICSIEPAARVMAVVKGNAYGHGMLETATALADVDAFAVARISEAAQLRDAGCEHPLVLLGGIVAESDLDLAAGLGVSLCVHNHEQIEWLENFACGAFEVWLKIDTGMHRLGFHTNVAEMAIARLNSCSAVKKLSLMTHLANADNLNDEITDRQMEQFSTLANDFKGDISIANSGGLFGAARSLQRFSNASREGRVWMRPGIALFGEYSALIPLLKQWYQRRVLKCWRINSFISKCIHTYFSISISYPTYAFIIGYAICPCCNLVIFIILINF